MSRARDLADVWNASSTGQLVDITSSFTRNAAWSASGTERVLHDTSNDLVYYQLGLYIDGTTQSGSEWQEPAEGDVIYTIASAYRPAEQFVTTFFTESFDSGTVALNTNGQVSLSFPYNYFEARFRVYINGWYRI